MTPPQLKKPRPIYDGETADDTATKQRINNGNVKTVTHKKRRLNGGNPRPSGLAQQLERVHSQATAAPYSCTDCLQTLLTRGKRA